MSAKKQAFFETLYKDHHPMVIQMCKGFTKGNGDLAKDLTQEVFVNVWKALEKFRGASSPKTWIYRITVNTCLNHIRNQKKKTTISIDDVQEVSDSPQSSAEEQKYQQLYKAIGELAEVDRLIIMMVLDDLGYSDIASVMGIQEGNLRVKIHRIKQRIRKILDHE